MIRKFAKDYPVFVGAEFCYLLLTLVNVLQGKLDLGLAYWIMALTIPVVFMEVIFRKAK